MSTENEKKLPFNEVFIERLEQLSTKHFGEIVEWYQRDKKPSFRVNRLNVDEAQAIEVLRSKGFEIKPVDYIDNAYVLENKTKRDLTNSQEYNDGWFYIQSLSSMLPVVAIKNLIEKDKKLKVLDMCSAPGSKTTQLAAVMLNDGHIVANDNSRQRLYQLASNLKSSGVKNTETSLYKGEFLWKKYGPVFDLVLLDAPCSGEGRFNVLDVDSYSDWSMKKVERLAALQKQLIFSAIMCLKPGGTLIYSTCTFAPEENEEVIQFALDKFENAIEIEKTFNTFPKDSLFQEGLLQWKEASFDSRMNSATRVYPQGNWEGFFVCKIKRVLVE